MYTLVLSTGIVTRDADGVQVAPADSPDNADFVAYIDWVHSGNQPTIIEKDQATIDSENAVILTNNTQILWQAATNYETNFISGTAIGLLTIGVVKGTPKATAIATWSGSIWTLYYARKATLTNNPIDPALLDFSSCGNIPYSIPDLRTELGM